MLQTKIFIQLLTVLIPRIAFPYLINFTIRLPDRVCVFVRFDFYARAQRKEVIATRIRKFDQIHPRLRQTMSPLIPQS